MNYFFKLSHIGTIVILVFILNIQAVFSQNLVPNPSFESYTSCPGGFSEFPKATDWFQPAGVTPEYFNACATGNVDVPNNFFGVHPARTGVAYAGSRSQIWEFMETELLCVLDSGETYHISFWVMSGAINQEATDGFGLAFLDSNNKTVVEIRNAPLAIRNPFFNYITNTASWEEVSGDYIANGTEKYLAIGNIGPRNDTVHNPGGSANYSYHFIDDVSVECLTCVGNITTIDTLICEGDSIYLENAFQTSAGIYYDTIPSVPAGCFVTIVETNLSISDTFADAGINATICLGKSVTLGGSGGVVYDWQPGNSLNQQQQNPIATPWETTIYSLRVTDSLGCVAWDSVTVFVDTPALFDLGSDTLVCGASDFSLLAPAELGTYLWSTGETTNSIIVSIDSTYILTITEGVCESIDSINVSFCKSIYIPNAFSPNQDGENDLFNIKTEGVAELSFKIYDRWGNKIFETKDVNMGWDGSSINNTNNKPANAGVYIYVINGTYVNGSDINLKGNLTLIR